MQDLAKYIVDNKQVIIPVVYVIGMLLKKTPKVQDWLIPWIILGISVALAIGIDVASGPFDITISIMQGILCAGASIFVNQLVKQTVNKN